MSVAIVRLSVPVPDLFAQCPDSAYRPYDRCTSTVLSDGSRLNLDAAPLRQDRPSGARQWAAQVTAPSGTQVVVSESSVPAPGGADTMADAPPLSLHALGRIAASAAWKPLMNVLPESETGSSSAATDTQPSGGGDKQPTIMAASITAALTPLLRDFRIADRGGSPGFGHLTVDDGHGRSLLAVNVQQWKVHDPALVPVFGHAEALSDGTLVTTGAGPSTHGGAGAVEWTADMLRPNGLRVFVSEVNAPGYGVPATRAAPPISLAGLRRISLDRTWQRFAEG
ncbi:hypothetical protein [Actinacidiphila guanduensis]|uniref:hypothetical protein n=1 Tax=Actinacidiphila guanduensis TaxID=310781 RepID=UPI00115FD8F0|nr:hypothetical protein [Actinacidiphila guanduensis]